MSKPYRVLVKELTSYDKLKNIEKYRWFEYTVCQNNLIWFISQQVQLYTYTKVDYPPPKKHLFGTEEFDHHWIHFAQLDAPNGLSVKNKKIE